MWKYSILFLPINTTHIFMHTLIGFIADLYVLVYTVFIKSMPCGDG